MRQVDLQILQIVNSFFSFLAIFAFCINQRIADAQKLFSISKQVHFIYLPIINRGMENESKMGAQELLLKKIRNSIPANISIVDELADLLSISNDSVYRRLRGETALSIDELVRICKTYNFSFDEFINSTSLGLVNCKYSPLNNTIESYKKYLQRIVSDMSTFKAANKREIKYAAIDVPLFYHFSQRELAAFKMFYWNRSILNVEEYQDEKFNFNAVDEELLGMANSVYEMYQSISSVEIWSDDTLNTTLKQIEYYWELGMFESKEDALVICSQIKDVFNRLHKQSELGLKLNKDGLPMPGEVGFKLYQADVMIGNNCILITMGDRQVTYTTYNTFNALGTTNPLFCNETEVWLKNLIQKSNLISRVGQKQRYRFFNHNISNLNNLIARIENA